jgi:ABC-2 type transport system ATP-binding protein
VVTAHPPAIEVRALSRNYAVREREPGLRAAARSLIQIQIQRTTRTLVAISDLSFEIPPGEVVGFVGPNGAGKTTTLKLLSGLLYPSSGEARVLGFIPSRRERRFLRQITLIAGNRNQLVWDLPVGDSFEVNRAIYGIEPAAFRQTLNELIDLLELEPLLPRPVRQLSLGERMKCELAAALLHRPHVLFLDEPTIGLDLTMQRRIRSFVADYNHRYGATVLLTSHDMADVERLCKRVIVLYRGRLLFDGDLLALVERNASQKTIVIQLEPGVGAAVNAFERFGEVISAVEGRVTLRVARSNTSEVAARLLGALPVVDLSIVDPSVEDVIEQVFARGFGDAPAGNCS